MSDGHDSGTRDKDAIERELRLLASVREAYRERGKDAPSLVQVDALLDELIDLEGTAKHRWENENSDAKPSLWL